MDRLFICYCLLVFFTICTVIDKAVPAAVETLKSAQATTSKTDDPLIYPGEPQDNGSLNRGGTSPEADPSPCPEGERFCESATDYPIDVIKSKLKKQPKLLLDILYEEEIGTDVHNKFGPDSESEMELCTSTAKIVYPNKAQSKEGLYEFIVNDDEHKQGIRVETCTSVGDECKMLPAHILPLGYKSSCVQKYILRTLVVLNRNSSDVQGFVTKPFEFPSCCSCVISMVDGHNRFGGELDTTPVNATTTVKAATPVNAAAPIKAAAPVNTAARPTTRPVKGTPKSVD